MPEIGGWDDLWGPKDTYISTYIFLSSSLNPDNRIDDDLGD